MLFGKSLFESVLDRMKTDAGSEDDETAATPFHFRMPFFGGALAGLPHENPERSANGIERAYRDALAGTEPPPPPVEQERIPEHLLRLSPDEIAADLDLDPSDTVQLLNEKRRAFARLNHPDGVPEAFRENAHIRMTLANRLVDEALRRRQGKPH